MPKSIEELRNCPKERPKKPTRMKVVLKDGRLVEVGVSPLTKEKFPSFKRVQKAREQSWKWRSGQNAKRAFNRDQYLAEELSI